LPPARKQVDYGQGGGGIDKYRDIGLKFFVVKILTSNFFDIKILQTLFADPAPVKAFGGWGEGGYPGKPRFSRNGTAWKAPFEKGFQSISVGDLHSNTVAA